MIVSSSSKTWRLWDLTRNFKPEDVENAYDNCQVIIDCTPSGNDNWENIYTKLDSENFFGSTVAEFTFVKTLKFLDTLASYP